MVSNHVECSYFFGGEEKIWPPLTSMFSVIEADT